uniref:Si:ch211-197g15.7 n=1 Tax=Cyprinus carpio TaxID=7962 RepID=A0A8C1PW95_CYPCA
MQKAKVRKVSTDTLTSNLPEERREQLCASLGNVELSLLYKASVHGYKASAFHQRCDRQGPTLVVAYNNSDYIFGGYTSVDFAQSGREISDEEAFLFSFKSGTSSYIKINSGYNARYDDAKWPNFGQQLYFCHNNQPVVYHQGGNAFNINTSSMYGNDTQLTECEVYKVEQEPEVSTEEKPWRNVLWTPERRAELMGLIKNHKPLMTSVSRVRILMIGPVGAGKSSFFTSINSIFTGHVTNKAMSGSAGTSLTVQVQIQQDF